MHDVCNFADDTTPFACNLDLENVLQSLEIDSAQALIWFDLKYMKLNAEKCHLMLCGNKATQRSVKIGTEEIFRSEEEKLLGVLIDSDLKFESYLSSLCKKVGCKITILCKIANFLDFIQKQLLFKVFIESQFSYCPLIWMFCSRKMNRRINSLQERALRIVYNDYTSSYDDLLRKDNCLTIHQNNIHKVAIEMFKIKNGLAPEFIEAFFKKHDGPTTRLNRDFLRPNVDTVYNGQMSFKHFGPIVWDEMLPEKYKICTSLDKFKESLKDWIPLNCCCRLCRHYEQHVGFIDTFE